MDYTHAFRRRLRAVRNLAGAAATPSAWGGRVVGTYWWAGRANFGDDLTRWLLPRYGIVPVHRLARDARLVGVGSVLQSMPPAFDGAVWGSGLLHDRPHPLPNAKVLAVRGPLTLERLAATADDVVLGDPGLLVSRNLARPSVRWDVGIVAHADHRSNAALANLKIPGDRRVRVIDVRQPAPNAVREIARCRAIVSTSLHGLITADSFSIPAVWTAPEPALDGGRFKFLDYEATVTPGVSRFAPFDPRMALEDLLDQANAVSAERIEGISRNLEAAIPRIADALDDLAGFPAGLMPLIGGAR